MGDFNINLLNINKSIMWTLYTHAFFPTTNSPMQITANSKTLIDNIFHNDATKNISGNITTSISDHLTVSTNL